MTSRRKQLAAWSKTIRARDGCCIVCGRVDHLQAHHLLPKKHFTSLQYELMNGVTVCPRCHQFGKDSFHQNGIASTLWLQANRQAQYNWVLQQLAQHQTTAQPSQSIQSRNSDNQNQ